MKKEPIIVNVYLWGTCIGKLNWDFEKHCSVFQFTDEYRKQDYDICPSTHPKRTPLFASFYGNRDKLYQGLPEFLADALPDRWGSSLFDQWLTDNNIKVTESLPLLKLSYIGKRAMGALEFEPEFNDDEIQETVDMSSLDNSMAKIKSLMFNANYTKLIFDMSRCQPNRTLISKIVKELIGWQPKAA